MKITLLTVGSVKTDWILRGCNLYSDRLRSPFTFEIVEVSASKNRDPAKQKEEESASLLKRLDSLNGSVWALDEVGKEFTSSSFASELESLSDKGESITFVLGGAFGLTDSVRDRADRTFALGKMTFPHELCRLIFLEQMYRAQEILKGSGYHH